MLLASTLWFSIYGRELRTYATLLSRFWVVVVLNTFSVRSCAVDC